MLADSGFVSNPYIAQSTWRAAPGSGYETNSNGLRGHEIGPQKRGWQLLDRERIFNTMGRIVKTRLRDDFEFVTIALPDWNVVDENAFLQNHFNRLKPDHII